MLTRSEVVKRLVLVRMKAGEDILLSLRKAVAESGLKSGVIVNGAGSVTSYHVHVVKSVNLPPGDEHFKGEGPYDIIGMSGLIIDGRVHAHITLSNTATALGGHMEEGCRVLTFCAAAIADVSEADLKDWDSF